MTQLMGILNITPDSFSDQGRWFEPTLAIQRGLAIVAEGADWLDIGGESTRPFATPVSEEEELRRVIPVIQRLRQEVTIPLSIDTMKVKVAQAALDAGATLINDVSGFRDPAMIELAAETQSLICVMHMSGTPQTMQLDRLIETEAIIPLLMEWFQKKTEQLLAAGIKKEKIILDPGIGFGKTVADNVKIIENLQEIKSLGFSVLIGLSRKSFLKKITGQETIHLLPATLAANTVAILAKVDIIRVHDVAAHRQMINCLAAFKDL
jgi:dihydropteroate synthase